MRNRHKHCIEVSLKFAIFACPFSRRTFQKPRCLENEARVDQVFTVLLHVSRPLSDLVFFVALLNFSAYNRALIFTEKYMRYCTIVLLQLACRTIVALGNFKCQIARVSANYFLGLDKWSFCRCKSCDPRVCTPH